MNVEGRKELLGMWIAEHEGAKFWAQVLTELNNSGLKDVFVFCIDGLSGFPEAIAGVFPKTDIQLCMVHMMRNSLRYVSYKDAKKIVHEFKEVYQSGTLDVAEAALLSFGEKWNNKYPAISEMWMRNRENQITIYSYPEEIRLVIYTTNAIESLNSVIKGRIRKYRIFNRDESALKAVWMTVIPASKQWTMPVNNWKTALNYFYVKFGDRLIHVA